jgi:hypothetical protein
MDEQMLAFEESRPFIFRDKQTKKKGLLDLEDEGTRSFQKFRTAHPTIWHHFLHDLNCLCESSFMAYCKQLVLLATKKEMQN